MRDRVAMVLGVVLAGFAGLHASAHDRRDRFAAGLARLARFADDMCTCRDDACRRQVSDAMLAWSIEVERSGRDPLPIAELDAPTRERLADLGKRLATCATRGFPADGASP